MDALESLRITGPCEMSPALSKLINLVRRSKSSHFTTLELSTCDALYHFAEPRLYTSDICDHSKWMLQR